MRKAGAPARMDSDPLEDGGEENKHLPEARTGHDDQNARLRPTSDALPWPPAPSFSPHCLEQFEIPRFDTDRSTSFFRANSTISITRTAGAWTNFEYTLPHSFFDQ